MLAAAPSPQSDSLELIRLALSMVRSGEPNIPDSLKIYFSTVIEQARTLAGDPSSVQGEVLPEAIDLALEIRSVKEFSDEIERIESVDTLSPGVATKLLSVMEKHPVYQD